MQRKAIVRLREADLTDDTRLTLPQLAELLGEQLGTTRTRAHRDPDHPPLRSLSKSKHGRKYVIWGEFKPYRERRERESAERHAASFIERQDQQDAGA